MTSRLSTNLKNKARYWAGEITKKARAYAPAHIRDAISSHVEDISEGEIIIRTIADGKKHKDVRAWEYGSGIHARRGAKAKYIIAPKNAPRLAFPWQVIANVPDGTWFGGRKLVKKSADGEAVFNYVEHPGIQAANGGVGYIAPAQIEIRKRFKEALKEATAEAIRLDLRESFRMKR